MLGGFFLYTSFFNRTAEPQPQQLAPIVRTVEIVAAKELETRVFPGVAKESQIAKLSFRVAGKMVETNITIGAKIKKGELVAKLDSRDYELAVKRLQSELASAESLLNAMKTGARPEDLATVESQLVAAQTAYDTAKTNLDRFTSLLADSVATQAQFDLVNTQFETAKGNKETLENELEKAKTGSRKEEIAAAEARIEGLKASLTTAVNALDDTSLTAPFDGMIVEKFVEDYEVLAPGVPVASFVDTSIIDVAVSLPEDMIVRMSDIRNYRVEFESYPGVYFPAVLKELGQAIQRGRQSYPLLVGISLDEGTEKYPLFSGMTAMVSIDLARAEIPQIVPLSALTGEGNDTGVWGLEPAGDDHYKTVRKSVKLVRVNADQAEIQSDLKPNDKVVAAGARYLYEAQLVKLEE